MPPPSYWSAVESSGNLCDVIRIRETAALTGIWANNSAILTCRFCGGGCFVLERPMNLKHLKLGAILRTMRPKKVILCVDDNEQELSVLKFMLTTNGYRVLAAKTGRRRSMFLTRRRRSTWF